MGLLLSGSSCALPQHTWDCAARESEGCRARWAWGGTFSFLRNAKHRRDEAYLQNLTRSMNFVHMNMECRHILLGNEHPNLLGLPNRIFGKSK